MSTFINNNEFMTNGIISTMSHSRNKFIFDDYNESKLNAKKIYTTPSGKQRFQKNQIFEMADDAKIEPYTMFFRGNILYSMGAFSSSNSQLPVNSIVGRYTSIAHNVIRTGGNHPTNRFSTSMVTYFTNNVAAFKDYLLDSDKSFTEKAHGIPNGSPIVIGNDVWIGQDVKFVSTGITVGDGAVVAAGSLVTKNVPPYAIVGGSPAKIIKFRFEPHIIQKLLDLKWWQYAFGDFEGVAADDNIEIFIDKIISLRNEGKLLPFNPDVATINDFK